MAYSDNHSQLPIDPNNQARKSEEFLPKYFRTLPNRKFLSATVDQMISQGNVEKISGYVGRRASKSRTANDSYIRELNDDRTNYQFEPSLVIKDDFENLKFFANYNDITNAIKFFGNSSVNHSEILQQEYYAWNPLIDWDKLINYREYYWLPNGPEPIRILGQAREIVSSYTVTISNEGDNYAFLFNPDGQTRNPVVTLYRGQTYRFVVNSPNNKFYIKQSRVAGVDDLYPFGIQNNGVENGVIIWTVPADAPETLYYVSDKTPNTAGLFKIYNVEENTFINVERDIIGKRTYSLNDGTLLSNGMRVYFDGEVEPVQYQKGYYYVEGVGTSINLVPESELEIIAPYNSNLKVPFDSDKFDSLGFDISNFYPGVKDYITVNRSSIDRNQWSRSNRWFHKNVIETSSRLNNILDDVDSGLRANRPIIEFVPNLKLYNFGSYNKKSVDLVDDYTTDVFSTIEGAIGYNIDNVQLYNGMRILFTADPDILVNGKIYEVKFIKFNGRRQIALIETDDSAPLVNETVLVKQGQKYQGSMWSYNGIRWSVGQTKSAVNQPPLFDVFDKNELSLGNVNVYPGTNFAGNKIFSYATGTATNDVVLGFPLQYKNINNIGDIVFDFNLNSDIVTFKETAGRSSIASSQCFVKRVNKFKNEIYVNGWVKGAAKSRQPVIRIYQAGNLRNFFAIDCFNNSGTINDLVVKVYVNGVKKDITQYEIVRQADTAFVRFFENLQVGDIVKLKCYTRIDKNQNGFYDIPINLQNNPDNQDVTTFTFGEVLDHVDSIVENSTRFFGAFPGQSNLRDAGFLTKFGTKFVQHSGPIVPLGYHLIDSQANIIKAIRQANSEYTKFKKSIILTAENIGMDAEPRIMLDAILKDIVASKNGSMPYAFSDMLGYTNYTLVEHEVIDQDLNEFALSTSFNLRTLSNKAVGVYLNGDQLLHGTQYIFTDEGFVRITASIELGDKIEIREYNNTDGNYIPPTPSKLGLYPAFEPAIFTDDSYQTPKLVIQGHDGSIAMAYGDFRDYILLEFEKRIYNNIKQQYNPEIFDIHDYVPGYGRITGIGRKQLDDILKVDFLKWAQYVDQDYTRTDLFYQLGDEYSYNYGKAKGPRGGTLPGFYKGIYRWIFDTERPHSHPWECLGFYVKPTWWEDIYGPAPYTVDNQVLWEDIQEGIIREPGKIAVRKLKYKRIGAVKYAPVDEFGNLADPLTAGVAQDFLTLDARENMKFGDGSPVESAWRRSSAYPFSIITAILLSRPADVFSRCYDLSRTVRNKAGQLVDKDTDLRFNISAISKPSTIFDNSTRIFTSGLVDYIYGKLISKNSLQIDTYVDNLNRLSAQMAFKLGGYSTKDKLKLLLDSRTPNAQGSIFVPDENYSIYTVKSSVVENVNYSAVIIEKLAETDWKPEQQYVADDIVLFEGYSYVAQRTSTNQKPLNNVNYWRRFDNKEVARVGFVIRGYNTTNNVFKYYKPIVTAKDRAIRVGAISEEFVIWQPNKFYSKGIVVQNNTNYYRVLKDFVSPIAFDTENLGKISRLPSTGGVTAIKRRNFDTEKVLELSYGTILPDVQSVVDFLFGYGKYLETIGFDFSCFNQSINTVTNWTYAAAEYMFWAAQGWAPGSVISVSPAADEVKFTRKNYVVDNQLDNYYDYTIFQGNGLPVDFDLFSSIRQDNEYNLRPRDTDEGIFNIDLNLVQVENVVVIDDVTVFNDTIYDKSAGYRQERVKVVGYRTSNWNGTFAVPGFVYDQAIVSDWQAWKDYAVGDLVKYKEFYYAANRYITGKADFEFADWQKLEGRPEARFLPNWDYKASQFEDFYDLETDNFDLEQQKLGQHLIGYQDRQYLTDLINDPVSRYKFYQGFITEKGTINSITKLFDKLGSVDNTSIEFYEDFAFRLGQYGAVDGFKQVEYLLDENSFRLNPQPVELTDAEQQDNNLIYAIPSLETYSSYDGYNHQPFPLMYTKNNFVKTAGYVDDNDVSKIYRTLRDVVGTDISSFKVGDYVWATFEDQSWNVYRFQQGSSNIVAILETDDGFAIQFEGNVPDEYAVGSVFGLTNVAGIEGFWIVNSVQLDKLYVVTGVSVTDITNLDSTPPVLYRFVSVRYNTIDDYDFTKINQFKNCELLWADTSSVYSRWQVWKNEPVYESIKYTGSTSAFGASVAVDSERLIMAVGNTTAENVTIYFRTSETLDYTAQFSVTNPAEYTSSTDFGNAVAMSPDGEWLVVGAPSASFIRTKYRGMYDPTADYDTGDIVRNKNCYWEARNPVTPGHNDSSITFTNDDWRLRPNIPLDVDGDAGIPTQGFISFYRKGPNNTYLLQYSITEPAKDSDQKFGTKLKIVSVGDSYRLFASAPGFNQNQGKVFIYDYVENGDSTDGWNQAYNKKFKGIFDTHFSYEVGDIVYFSGKLYKALVNIPNDGSTIDAYSQDWQEYTGNDFLPFRPHPYGDATFPFDSSSYLAGGFDEISDSAYFDSAIGLYSTVENVKRGDNFGYDFDVSADGNTLVISAPYADDADYDKFKGIWRLRDQALYQAGDVVRYNLDYYICRVPNAFAANFDSINEWELIRPWAGHRSGKVFVYRFAAGGYQFTQEITPTSIPNLPTTTVIGITNRIGSSVSLNAVGDKLALGVPLFDDKEADSGAVLVLKNSVITSTFPDFVYESVVKPALPDSNQQFGHIAKFNAAGDQLVIVTASGTNTFTITFDKYSKHIYDYPVVDTVTGSNTISLYVNDTTSTVKENLTTFDNGSTTFSDSTKNVNQLSVYDKYENKYIFGESFALDGITVSSSIDDYVVFNNSVYVPLIGTEDNDGAVHIFAKPDGEHSWMIYHNELDRVAIDKFKSIFLFDKKQRKILTYLDYIDPIQGKIAGPAEQELMYKVPYDPAFYSVGNTSVNVDDTICWLSDHVGELWWDLSTARFVDPYQGNLIYQTGSWNTLAYGASIDVYEWIESSVLPSVWDSLADTEEGLALGISGRSKYSDLVYSTKIKYDTVSQTTSTTYYFWVKGKTVVPNRTDRSLSAATVAKYIEDPKGQNYNFAILLDSNKFALVNSANYLDDQNVGINFRYWTLDNTELNIHNHYELISEGYENSIPNEDLLNKWFDSLIGFDEALRQVPDRALKANQAYGILNKPRQGMFINRIEAANQFINAVNDILQSTIVVDDFDLTQLLSKDQAPTFDTGKWDYAVDTKAELATIKTNGFRNASISSTIQDGKITAINVITIGKGYKEFTGNTPEIRVVGKGKDFSYSWNTTTVDVVDSGSGYRDDTLITVRPISVLVRSDEDNLGLWSIYQWNTTKKSWVKYSNQTYDTTKYWSYVDWYDVGYNQFTVEDFTVDYVYQIPELSARSGDIVKVRNVGTGGWTLYEKISNRNIADISKGYKVIGRQNGTIQISQQLSGFIGSNVGFGGVAYDSDGFEVNPAQEFRNILEALRNDILIRELADNFNKLFFYSVKYVLHEQPAVDWVIKTSLIKAVHNLGELQQKVTFKSDVLESYEDYIKEVKPYRTKIREFVSAYQKVDPTNTLTTDFDLPAYFDTTTGEIKTVTAKVIDQTIAYNDTKITQVPYNTWLSNTGYEIIDVVIISSGSGYVSTPKIELDGIAVENAELKAYIGLGKLTYIQIVNPGIGYIKPPTISFNSGLAAGGTHAKAVAILGNGLARTFNTKLKFDRIATQYNVDSYNELSIYAIDDTVVSEGIIYKSLANNNSRPLENSDYWKQIYDGSVLEIVDSSYVNLNGSVDSFTLEWPMQTAKRFVTVVKTINGIDETILDSDFTVENVLDTTASYTRYYGKLNLETPPEQGSNITIIYRKDINLLDAANRVLHLYTPGTGQPGKELGQLMRGVDYGGVEVTGINFDISAGWDADELSPWGMTPYDSFDQNFSDFVVISDGTTREFTLPYTPTEGTEITVYLRRALNSDQDSGGYWHEQSYVRIDDPYYDLYDGVTEQPNGRLIAPPDAKMNTIVSNGSTSVSIPENVTLHNDDKIIFRKIDSDGTYTPYGNIYDTELGGGSLSYGNATGIKAEDINIDGDDFQTPYAANMPEEIVPGQIFDSVAISVYTNNVDKSPLILHKHHIGNGGNKIFDIGQYPTTSGSIIVRVNNLIIDDNLYTIDYANKTVTFITAPANNAEITIVSMSQAGNGVVETDVFISDGSTLEFVTGVLDNDNYTVVCVVNGANVSIDQFTTDETYDLNGYVGFRINTALPLNTIISYSVCLGPIISLSQVETENLTASSDGSGNLVTNYALLRNAIYEGPFTSMTVVENNGYVLQAPDTFFFDVVGNNKEFLIDTRYYPLGISPSEVEVYVNGELKDYGSEYQWFGLYNKCRFRPNVVGNGDRICIAIYRRADYKIYYTSDISTLATAYIEFYNNVSIGDNLTITTYSVQDVLGIERFNHDVAAPSTYTAGSIVYYDRAQLLGGRIKLPQQAFSSNYLWVMVDRLMLTPNQDYILEDNLEYIRLDSTVNVADTSVLEVMMFNNYSQYPGTAFKMFKDILNRNTYTKISENKTTQLAKDLTSYDTEIELVDGSVIPNNGTIEIKGELIDFAYKEGNILTQLRRGTKGTGCPELHIAGSFVKDQSSTLQLPYADQTSSTIVDNATYSLAVTFNGVTDVAVSTNTFTVANHGFLDKEAVAYNKNGNTAVVGGLVEGRVYYVSYINANQFKLTYNGSEVNITATATGTHKLIGSVINLSYIPAATTYASWYRNTIPVSYKQCNEIEVFVGGTRLRKTAITVFDADIAQGSPEGDVQFEAEFSVNGIDAHIRLTAPPVNNERIEVVKRTGTGWATTGQTLSNSTTKIANFINSSPGKWHE